MIMAGPSKSRLWPGMIFALIGMNFCVVGFTVYASSRRAESNAVEPDYDRKALHWNRTATQLMHNRELGWSIQLPEFRPGSISASLTDRNDQPVQGARLTLEAFHHAHAANRIQAELQERQGLYFASIPLDEPGLWELRFTAQHGSETFTATMTRMLTEMGK